MDLIPSLAQRRLLPPKHLAISEFLLYDIPSAAPGGLANFMHPEKYFCLAEPTSKDPHSISLFLPPPDDIVDALHSGLNSSLARSIQCLHDTSAGGQRYPLWLVTYWFELKDMRRVQRQWALAVWCLEDQLISPQAIGRDMLLHTLTTVNQMPWTGVFHGANTSIPIHSLTAYFTTEWLTDNHESLMLEILENDAAELQQADQIQIQSPFFIPLLKAAHANRDVYNTAKMYEWLQVQGTDMSAKEDRQLASILNCNENHWTALVVAFGLEQTVIHYGDSMGHGMDLEAKVALDWWIKYHTGKPPVYKALPTTQQDDSHSCGVLAWNAITHRLFPARYPLLDASKMAEAQLRIFMLIVNQAILRATDKLIRDAAQDEPVSNSSDVAEGHAESPNSSLGMYPDDKDGMELSSQALDTMSMPEALPMSCYPATKTAGIMNFFMQSSKTAHNEFIMKAAEETRQNVDDLKWKCEKHLLTEAKAKRENTRERKQEQRDRERDSEIKGGLRSPGGHKLMTHPLVLHDTADSGPRGGAVPELSRPEHSLKMKFTDQCRKPQGRKLTSQRHPVCYINWLSPFLFRQIELAAKHVGGPWMSTWLIVKELHRQDSAIFNRLSPSTIEAWIDRTDEAPRWSDAILARAERGHDPGHNKGGRIAIFKKHPEVADTIVKWLRALRDTGAQITLVTARAVMIATVTSMKPEILKEQFADGSTFCASDSFLRKWLCCAIGWSLRKGTQAAHKFEIKEEDVPPELLVNSDQTQAVFAPGDKMTWAETGAKQVSVISGDEKRVFTVLVSVSCSGAVLPLQAIYTGRTVRSTPSKDSACYNDVVHDGFLLKCSGTSTYWSNMQTMQNFVTNILVPYFDGQKKALGLPPSQKSIWSINLSLNKSYHEDIVKEMMDQLDQNEVPTLDNRIGTLRDHTPKWLWKAYNIINKPELVKKAFELCTVRGWNLSYTSLTGVAARAKLCELKHSDPEFWEELTGSGTDDALPLLEDEQPEDLDLLDEGPEDNSDIPISLD
ncbi:hypothetical protein DXG01_016182 [Tephrocybe rancida]|nr:hypothetical protein DXG01_016182 [Tephrocybe rancida]